MASEAPRAVQLFRLAGRDPTAELPCLGEGADGHGGDLGAPGVSVLGSLVDVSTCLERRHTCRVQQMIETEMPRVEELLDVAP